MSRITLAREYPDDRDVIAQICKLKSRTSATEKETSQIEQHLNETDQRVSTLETVTQGLAPEDIEMVKTVAGEVPQLRSDVTVLDGRVGTLENERTSDRQYIESVADDVTILDGRVGTLETERTSDRQYIEAVAGDLVQNYATKNALQGVSASAGATQTQLTNLAAEIQTTHPYVTTNTEQTITAVKNISVIGSSAQSIVNKDWIWNTEASADNGLLHRNGDETKHGALTVNTLYLPRAGNANPLNYSEITSGGLKRNIMSLAIDGNNWTRLILQLNPNNTATVFLEGMANGVYYSKSIKSSTDAQ